MDEQTLIQAATQVANREASALPASYIAELFAQQVSDLGELPKGLSRRKVLLVGGGGYVGTVVAAHLIETGYDVRCLDNFIYGHSRAISHFLNEERFEFINGDLRVPEDVDKALDGVSDVVILAGLVGDPITKKYPDESQAINHDGLISFMQRLGSAEHLLRAIFVSTCSNYGLIESGEPATEDAELRPLSLYAKAKVALEHEALSLRDKVAFPVTVLRFATAFGLSARMRFDLTVNEFARDLALGRELVVFDPDTWRPYCHVCDFSTLIRRVLEAPRERIDFQVFNAGGDENNSTKRALVETIQRHLPESRIEIQLQGPDPRNYRVDFRKVRETLHFTPSRSIEDGVLQVIKAVRSGLFHESDPLYGNYDLVNV